MTQRADSIEIWYGWVVVAASLMIGTIAMAAPNILFVSLKPIAADFGWPRAGPSMAFSLLMIGSGVGGIAMGWWTDKRGVMQPVLFGSVMVGLGALLASQSTGRWDFYTANGLLMGAFGEAAMIAPLIANGTRWFDRHRGLAVAILASGQGIAGAIWPPVVKYMNDVVGWRETYFYFGVLALVTLIPLSFLLKRKPPFAAAEAARESSMGEFTVLGYSPRVVQGLFCVAVIGCCTAMAMPIVHLFSHATDLGFSRTSAANMLSVLFGASFFIRIAFGMLADRIGGVKTILVASSCQAVMLVAFAFATSEMSLYISALMFGIGFAGIMPNYSLIIRLWYPSYQIGWRVALTYLFAAIGMAFGGWLGGTLYDLTGTYTDAFLVGFGFNVINLGVIWFLFTRQTQLRLNPLPI